MTQSDPFHLVRFVEAQDSGGTYERALAELRRGRKTSHWMWFVFPQIAGLGQSAISKTYAIRSLDEARAYLDHPVLGARLRESADAAASAPTDRAEQLLGGIDAQKLQSSMTLFALAAPGEHLFQSVLDHFFDGEHDPGTVTRV